MRYCIDCNIPIGKGVKRCVDCKHTREILQSRSYYKTKYGISLKEEQDYITKWVNEGNNTALKISNKYKEVLGKSRSLQWITNKLKKLDIYTLDRKNSAWERDREHREQRNENADKWGYNVKCNTTRHNTLLECKRCGTIQRYKNVMGRGGKCSQCDKTKRHKKDVYKYPYQNKKQNPNYVSPHTIKKEKLFADIEHRFTNRDSSVIFKKKSEFSNYLTNKGYGSNRWLNEYLNYNKGVNVDIQQEIKKLNEDLSKHLKYYDEVKGLKGCSKCNQIKDVDKFNKSRSPFICNDCYYIDVRIKAKQNKLKNPSKYLASKISLYIREYAKRGWGKNSTRSLVDYLGIDVDTYKNYIESLWEDGMSWDNTDEWHIDHIIPRCWFTQSERQIMAALNWRNTRPEWKDKNLYKGWRFDADTELHLIQTEWLEEFSDVIDIDKILSFSFVMKQPGQMKLLKQIRNTF